MSYQAKPMLVRELNLGEVNHHLYNHLAQLIGSRGNPTVQELLYAQQEQQSILHYLIDTLSIPRQRTSMESVLYGNNPAILIEELVEREKELAVVYDSYSYYLAPYYHLSPSLNRLQYLQKGKLNALQMLGENLGKLKGFLKGADYWLEDGYELEHVVSGLTYPTSLVFDDEDELYVGEAGYSYGPAYAKARILHITKDGDTREIAGGFDAPLTGIAWHEGYFYVITGSQMVRCTG